MAKKKNKKMKKTQIKFQNHQNSIHRVPTEEDSFWRLEWIGKKPKYVDEMNKKGFKKVKSQNNEQVVLGYYNPKPILEIIKQVESLALKGHYKGIDKIDYKETLKHFIHHYQEKIDSEDLQKTMDEIAKDLIIIGKSFYEYSDGVVFIEDSDYDKLLAVYLCDPDHVEPCGIIPKGMKNLKKVEIRYPLLHNNMDKSYRISNETAVPEGVKETTSVEDFLTRSYKELDMDLSSGILKLEVSPKIDGVSINGTVHHGRLVNPQTRGDKSESVLVLGLNGLKVSDVDNEEPFGIQYEAFVTEENRVAVSKYLDLRKEYVSCRHAASGIIHRLCTTQDDKLVQYLNLYPIESTEQDLSYEKRMDKIKDFGVYPKGGMKIQRNIIEGNYKHLLSLIETGFVEVEKIRSDLPYAIDGVVLTVVDDQQQEKLGRSGRTNKYQIALKFDPSTATGIVDHIDLDVGMKGFRTIQVYLKKPVYLDGVQYDHIPVLSAEIYDSLDLRKEDEVVVHRVGDVIPAISVSAHKSKERLELPVNCPECGSPLQRKARKLYCENPDCSGNIRGKFNGFFKTLDMVGYGDAFSKLLVERMQCKSIHDLIQLDEKTFSDRGINLAITRSFPQDLREKLENNSDIRILAALGLSGVGIQKAAIILQEIPFMELTEVDFNKLQSVAVKAVGPNQAASLATYMTSDAFKQDMESLKPFVKNITTDFTKKTRVGHTGGNLSEDTRELIEKNNFVVVDGKAFDILITSTMDTNSSKMEIAKRKKLPIFTEDSFKEKYQNFNFNVNIVREGKPNLNFNVNNEGTSNKTESKKLEDATTKEFFQFDPNEDLDKLPTDPEVEALQKEIDETLNRFYQEPEAMKELEKLLKEAFANAG